MPEIRSDHSTACAHPGISRLSRQHRSLLRYSGSSLTIEDHGGYLYHETDSHDRSEANATHARVEAYLPELGWIGFDPTNNLIAGERHIRTAVGRDYADVPPTRGIFKGLAQSELSVGVHVSPTEAPPLVEELLPVTTWIGPPVLEEEQQQQQQQQ